MSSITSTQKEQIRADVFDQSPGLDVTARLFGPLPRVLFCVKDRSRRYVDVNQAFATASLLDSPRDLIGLTATEVFPTRFAAGYEQQDEEVFAHGIEVSDRVEMITRADGGIGWFVSHKIPIRTHEGSIIALAGISRDLAVPAENGAELGRLKEAIDLIHHDYSKPIKIGELAEIAGLSRSQFQRRMVQITGLAPRQLLTKVRVNEAARLLGESRLSISAIALMTGFYDQPSLSRKFKAMTGMSPRRYRDATRS